MRIRSVVVLAVAAAPLAMASQAPNGMSPAERALAHDAAAQRTLKWAMPDGPGSGHYAAMHAVDAAFPGHVIYRPRDIAAVGRPLAILLWGNGGCRADGASARLFLTEIASHGYLIVVPGSIVSGADIPMPAREPDFGMSTTVEVQAGLDLAIKANAEGAPYHGKLDLNRVAVAGTSCGGLQALQVAADPRVKAVVALHTGFFNDYRSMNGRPVDRAMTGTPIDKAQLLGLHTPVLYLLGGPTDVAYANGMDDFQRIDHVPVMLADHAVGHLGTFNQANGGVEAAVTLAWLQWQLDGDTNARAMFVGEGCRLCDDKSWAVKRKNADGL